MFDEIAGRARQGQWLSPHRLLRAAVGALGISMLGLAFRRAHRWLPAHVQLASTDFFVASVLFVGAAALRHCVLGGESLEAVLVSCGATYAVLLLVSVVEWIAEFTLYLCISAGIDMLFSALWSMGAIGADAGIVQSAFFLWQLAATFTAMMQLRLAREPVFEST